MLFFLFPAAMMLALAGDTGAAVTQISNPPLNAAGEPTFDPNAPPSWWTTKMRQPCSKTGDRLIC